MGLLAVVMTPAEAAAILVLPSLVTNLWQLLFGPSLVSLARRLWPMLGGICIGTWAGAGQIAGADADSPRPWRSARRWRLTRWSA